MLGGLPYTPRPNHAHPAGSFGDVVQVIKGGLAMARKTVYYKTAPEMTKSTVRTGRGIRRAPRVGLNASFRFIYLLFFLHCCHARPAVLCRFEPAWQLQVAWDQSSGALAQDHIPFTYLIGVAVEEAKQAIHFYIGLAEESLRDLIDRHCQDPPGFAITVDYARQVLKGLQFMHARHLIHCDIKPENILVSHYTNAWGRLFTVLQVRAAARGVAAHTAPRSRFGTAFVAADRLLTFAARIADRRFWDVQHRQRRIQQAL